MKLTSFNNLLAAAFVVSAAAGVAVSCQQTPTGPETPDPLDDTTTEVIIPVSLERPINPDADSTTPDTRVTVNPTNGVTAWSEGDQIAIWIYNTGTSTGAYKTATVKDKAVSLAMSTNDQRQGYAIYPATSWAGNATTVQVQYPSSYDMKDKDLSASNFWAPTPMVAINTEGDDLRFFHVGGLLRLHITDIPTGTTSLQITFQGITNLFGTFTVNNSPGTITATANTYAGSGTTNILNITNVTLSNNEVYLNIPIPAVSLSSLTAIKVACSGSGGSYNTQRDISGWGTMAHAQGKKATVSFVSVSFLDGYDGTFNGGLVLSPGILKYDGNSETGSHGYTLTSGENPLELLDYYNQSSSISVYYHMWSKESHERATESLKYRIDGNHLVENITGTIKVNGEYYRLPTQSDWSSIVSTAGLTSKFNSASANARFFKCSVNLATATNVCGNDYSSKGLTTTSTIAGVVLIPEYVSISCPGVASGGVNTEYASNPIPWSSVKKLTDAGCIFLPAAGRYADGEWNLGGSNGFYWSSSINGSDLRYRHLLYIANTNLIGNNSNYPDNFFNVHLIKIVD